MYLEAIVRSTVAKMRQARVAAKKKVATRTVVTKAVGRTTVVKREETSKMRSQMTIAKKRKRLKLCMKAVGTRTATQSSTLATRPRRILQARNHLKSHRLERSAPEEMDEHSTEGEENIF